MVVQGEFDACVRCVALLELYQVYCCLYRSGVYEIVEQTKKELFQSWGVDVTIAKVPYY